MNREQAHIYEQNDRVLRRVAGKIGLGMIFFLLIFYGLELFAAMVQGICVGIAPDKTWPYIVGEIASILAYVFGFLIPAFLLRRMLKKSKDYYPMGISWKLPRITPLLIVGAIALNFAAAYFNSFLVSALFPTETLDLSALADRIDEPYEIVFLFISTAVVPALVEEIFFRGVVLNALLPFGGTTAILGSALLFALMHGNLLQLFYTALMGVILGYIYVRTRSIWCGVLIHFFNNALSVAQEVIADLPDADTALRWNAVIESIVLLAGAFAVFGLLLWHVKRRRPEDSGSFGTVLEPSIDYQRYPTTRAQTATNFFAPTMIVFVILSSLGMLISLFGMLIIGRI